MLPEGLVVLNLREQVKDLGVGPARFPHGHIFGRSRAAPPALRFVVEGDPGLAQAQNACATGVPQLGHRSRHPRTGEQCAPEGYRVDVPGDTEVR
jgi:hypothetical protein